MKINILTKIIKYNRYYNPCILFYKTSFYYKKFDINNFINLRYLIKWIC